MPSSYLKRHRTICAVLEDIREIANHVDMPDLQMKLNQYVDEAKTYAQSMSNKLVEYKKEKSNESNSDE